MNNKALRDELTFLLTRGNAHMPFEEAIADFPKEKMNEIFPHGKYSFWGLLEHMRRTQKDILNFIIDENYKEPKWPVDYWPKKNEKADTAIWDKTIKEYLDDRESLVNLIKNPETDLYKKVPWGTGQTFIREVLVISDHNSYEIGEFAIMRQVLQAWPKSRKD